MHEFVLGRCYFDKTDTTSTPKIMMCRKSILHGKKLVPIEGLIRLPILPDSPLNWVDCTEQVRRTEALRNCGCPQSTTIASAHVGTIITFDDEDGNISPPHFLYAYSNGMAYLMSLDGRAKLTNMKLDRCYPVQALYKDIADRAISADPMRCSVFDPFFRWLRNTSQYNEFVAMVDSAGDNRVKEDMIRLFEVLSYSGVRACDFEATVDRYYETLPASKSDYDSKYAAVLDLYKHTNYSASPIDQEIMRATNFKYATPQEAWKQVGGGTPYPKNLLQLAQNMVRPMTSHQYVCDRLGIYDGDEVTYWYSRVVLDAGLILSLETDYMEGVQKYLEVCPEMDMEQLSFIEEEDKEAVFKTILRVDRLDPVDPFRAWTKNPPQHFKNMLKQQPDKSYVEIFKDVYIRSRGEE